MEVSNTACQCPSLSVIIISVAKGWKIYIYIYAFSRRRFYPKRLTVHSGYDIFISMRVPWELNPRYFAVITQCSTTEPQEQISRNFPKIPGRFQKKKSWKVSKISGMFPKLLLEIFHLFATLIIINGNTIVASFLWSKREHKNTSNISIYHHSGLSCTDRS